MQMMKHTIFQQLDGRVGPAEEEALKTLAAAAGSMEKDKARKGWKVIIEDQQQKQHIYIFIYIYI